MGKVKDIHVLLLEDDLETLSRVLQCLYELQNSLKDVNIAVTTFSEYEPVEKYLNQAEKNIYDIVILDRDTFEGGSFHALDLNKYEPDKVIGISSIPPYNEELRAKGVKRLVHKDYQNLDAFIEKVKAHLEEMLLQVLGRR